MNTEKIDWTTHGVTRMRPFVRAGINAALSACGARVGYDDIENIMQITLMRFFSARDRYENTAPIRSIAFNCTIDYLRRRPDIAALPEFADIPFPDSSSENYEELISLILKHAPNKCKAILHLILDGEPADARSLAERAGLSYSTARVYLSDARKVINRVLFQLLDSDVRKEQEAKVLTGHLPTLDFPMPRSQRAFLIRHVGTLLAWEVRIASRSSLLESRYTALLAQLHLLIRLISTDAFPKALTTEIDPSEACSACVAKLLLSATLGMLGGHEAASPTVEKDYRLLRAFATLTNDQRHLRAAEFHGSTLRTYFEDEKLVRMDREGKEEAEAFLRYHRF